MGALQDIPNNPWGALVTTTEDAAAADNDPSLPCSTSTDRLDALENAVSALSLRVAELLAKVESWEADS